MNKTLATLSIVLTLTSGYANADTVTAMKLGTQLKAIDYILPNKDQQAVTVANKGTPALALAVHDSVATMTRDLVAKGEENTIVTIVPPLIDTLPDFAPQITEAAISNAPANLKDAVREAATTKVPALGLGGISFPPPQTNPGGGGPIRPTSPH